MFNTDFQLVAEKRLHIVHNSDPIVKLYFSNKNMKYIQEFVKKYVKDRTGVSVNTEQDLEALSIKMMENYQIYSGMQGDKSDIKKAITYLNKNTIEYYIGKVMNGIKAYKHYHSLISSAPTNYVPMPVNVSTKGGNVLMNNIGFESAYIPNQRIRNFNLNT